MNEITAYLHGVKARLECASDRQFALKAGLAYSHAYRFLHEDLVPSDRIIIKLAKMVGDDPAKILLIKQHVKAGEEAREYWRELRKKVGAGVLALVFTISFMLPSLSFAGDNFKFDGMYIMSNQWLVWVVLQ